MSAELIVREGKYVAWAVDMDGALIVETRDESTPGFMGTVLRVWPMPQGLRYAKGDTRDERIEWLMRRSILEVRQRDEAWQGTNAPRGEEDDV